MFRKEKEEIRELRTKISNLESILCLGPVKQFWGFGSDSIRLQTLEEKLDKLIDHLGLEYKRQDQTLPKFIKKEIKKAKVTSSSNRSSFSGETK